MTSTQTFFNKTKKFKFPTIILQINVRDGPSYERKKDPQASCNAIGGKKLTTICD